MNPDPAPPDPRTKEELLDRLFRERTRLEAELEIVPPEGMGEPGILDGWSAKDLVAHFALWEGWILDHCEQLLSKGAVTLDERDTRPTDEMNHLHYERNRHRPAEDVRTEEHVIFERIVQLIEAFDDRQFFEPNRYSFPPEVSLAEEIQNETYRHYLAHAGDLNAEAKISEL